MATYDSVSVIKHLTPETRVTIFSCVKEQMARPNDSFEYLELEQLKENCNELARRWDACLSMAFDSPQVFRCISKLHDVLQTIHNVKESSCDSGTLALQLAEGAEEEIIFGEKFAEWSPYEQCAFIYLNYKDFWERWTSLAIAQGYSQKRMCIRYPGLPRTEPTVDRQDMAKIEEALVAFFKGKKACRSCKIANYIRHDEYYYFATLQEKPQVLDIDDPEKDSFEPKSVRLPFKLFFSYDAEEGVFSLYAKVDSMESKELSETIVAILVGYKEPLTREPKPTYNLSRLKDRQFTFPTHPSDGIASVVIKSLTINPMDKPEAKITYEDKMSGAYATIEEFANQKRLTPDNIEVIKARLQFKMHSLAPFRSVSLELSLTGDDLPTKTERQCEMLKKYIKEWGLLETEEMHSRSLIGTLIDLSRAEIPTITHDFRESLPSAVRCALSNWQFLKPFDSMSSLKAGGCDNEIAVVQSDVRLESKVVGQSGSLYDVDDWETQTYLVDYTPLAYMLHQAVDCKGFVEEKIPNKVWWIGNKGREARDIYLVRNWDGFHDVKQFLSDVKNNSLVIYIGEKPDFVRIGKSTSENPATANEIQTQYYSVNGLVEYSEKGFAIDVQPIWENIKTMFAKRPTRRRPHPKPGVLDNARELIENKLWGIGRDMLAIVQLEDDGYSLNQTQERALTAIFHTKGDFARSCDVQNYELTRTLDAWGDKEQCPYGVVYRGLFDILVPSSKYKNLSDPIESRKRQLRDLYAMYPQKIKALQQIR